MADNTPTANTPSPRSTSGVLGYNLDWWNGALVVALGFVALAAVLVVLSTTGVIIEGKREALEAANEFERYKLDAGVQIATADARAAEATQKAIEAELRLVEFRKSRREILAEPGHVESFIEKIRPFAGTRFDIGHGPEGQREQWDFLWDIEPLFNKAGWVFLDWKPTGGSMLQRLNWTRQLHWYGLSNVLNVSLEMNPEGKAKLLPAAQALVDTLKGIGIEASIEPTIVSSQSANADAIHFMVGDKR
jgi:hypothetical protein